jgi:hypothetical protein
MLHQVHCHVFGLLLCCSGFCAWLRVCAGAVDWPSCRGERGEDERGVPVGMDQDAGPSAHAILPVWQAHQPICKLPYARGSMRSMGCSRRSALQGGQRHMQLQAGNGLCGSVASCSAATAKPLLLVCCSDWRCDNALLHPLRC